ncbi:MAG: tRNA pseudouridine(55) synthase TruB [Vicinamibacterales bacterium]
MTRVGRDTSPGPDGVLVVDKVTGPTSHDAVTAARRLLRTRRVGHTGTLDPLASGVLALVVGRATRLARFLSEGPKVYDARVRLGATTETDDAQGTPVLRDGSLPSLADVEAALPRFVGRQLQRPPAYSAKKVQGIRAYTLARASIEPALAPAEVEVHAIAVHTWTQETLDLNITCSKGFYVRAFARDLGEALGCGAYLLGLRRTRSGEFGLDQAVRLHELDESSAPGKLLPLGALLTELPTAELSPSDAVRISHGATISAGGVLRWLPPASTSVREGPGDRSTFVRLTNTEGELLGVALLEAGTGPALPLHPQVVLV